MQLKAARCLHRKVLPYGLAFYRTKRRDARVDKQQIIKSLVTRSAAVDATGGRCFATIVVRSSVETRLQPERYTCHKVNGQ
jgi:hypothetical protein